VGQGASPLAAATCERCRLLGLVGSLCGGCFPRSPWLARAVGVPHDLGIGGGILHFLGAYPFVLLFGTLALGTKLGRLKLGFFTLGSTAATLLVGIAVSLWAYSRIRPRLRRPRAAHHVFLNLFMFAVGLKVGPSSSPDCGGNGAKGVAIAVIVVGLNFAIALGGAKLCGLCAGFAPGLISGSMTDTRSSAWRRARSRPHLPAAEGVPAAEVAGNIAAAYAVIISFR